MNKANIIKISIWVSAISAKIYFLIKSVSWLLRQPYLSDLDHFKKVYIIFNIAYLIFAIGLLGIAILILLQLKKNASPQK